MSLPPLIYAQIKFRISDNTVKQSTVVNFVAVIPIIMSARVMSALIKSDKVYCSTALGKL